MYMLIHIINTYSMAEVLAVIAQVSWQNCIRHRWVLFGQEQSS